MSNIGKKFKDNVFGALFCLSTAVGIGGLFGAAQNAENNSEAAKGSLKASGIAVLVAGFSAIGATLTGKKLMPPVLSEKDISFDEIDRQIEQKRNTPTPSA